MKKYTIIIVSILAFILGYSLSNYLDGGSSVITNTDTITLYDSTTITLIDSVLVPYKVDSLIHDTVLQKVDSIAIIEAYFIEKSYRLDTTSLEIHAVLETKISKNNMIYRKLTLTNLRPIQQIINNNTYLTAPKFSILLGGGVGSQNVHLGGGLKFKKNIIIYNHNFVNEYSKHTISYYRSFEFGK